MSHTPSRNIAYFASCRDIHAVKTLMSQGGDIEEECTNALSSAIFHKDPYLTIVLLNGGAKIDCQKEGWSYLMQAIASTHIIELSQGFGFSSRFGFGLSMQSPDEENTEVVSLLIEAGANIDFADDNGWTPLILAAHNGKASIVQILIEANANFKAKSKKGTTALHIAGREGHEKVVKILFGAYLTGKPRRNLGDPIVWAAQYGYHKLIDALLSRRANVDGRDHYGKTALIRAVEACDYGLVEKLLAHGADVNATDRHHQTALLCAIKFGWKVSEICGWGKEEIWHKRCVGILRLLVKHPAIDVNIADKNLNTPLIAIARVSSHNNPDLENSPPEQTSTNSLPTRYSDIAEILIQKGANVNAFDKAGDSALDYALERGHKNTVAILRKTGAHINPKGASGKYFLEEACCVGNMEMVQYLIEAGVPVNPTLSWKVEKTPLMIAAENGHIEVVAQLLHYGAESLISAPYEESAGQYALMLAAQNGHIGVVKILIHAGGDADLALRFAAKGGHCTLVRELAFSGSNLDTKGNGQETAVLERLNKTYTSYDAHTALDYAMGGGHHEMVKLLIELGVKLPETSQRRWGFSSKPYWSLHLNIAKDGTASVIYKEEKE